MNILEVKELRKYFATQKAVDGISLEIKKGSIFGLLGPNGAGKTTLIRMITGIFYPDQGQILLNGKNFNPENDAKHIGYMPEERGLYKKMKIGEQALYLAQLKGISKKEATEKINFWFKRLEMESWWNKKVEDLSKGMQQKLQFVITVLHEPDLIILDEPFSGLDPINANLIKDEIYRLAKNGASIIFSTHRMEQVEEICDHIALVNKGNKILDGTVAEVKEQFKENLFEITLSNEEQNINTSAFEVVKIDNKKITVKINEGSNANEVLSYFIQKNNVVQSFREVLPTLNEIFIKLVGDTPSARLFNTITN
jgi:ABC-2 type transport system ATP-binding protein